MDRGVWTAKTVKRPRQQPAHPQYATYWAPLTRKRHTMPHSAQSQHANYWAPRTRKRHQQEHRPQRPTESSDPTQHAKGRTGDRPGPRKGATTRRNVTQGGGRQRTNGTSRHNQHTPARSSQCWSRQTPAWTRSVPLDAPGQRHGRQPVSGTAVPRVVKQQDKSSGGSGDTTKTRSGPQRVRMSNGERPIGAAKGKQSDTEALCQPPPPSRPGGP